MNEPVTIPDEAFQQAAEVYVRYPQGGFGAMRAALEAAAPALREQFLTAAGLERTPVGITPDGVVIDEWRPGPALLARWVREAP